MIIGNGMIAKTFKNSRFNDTDFLVFASGVSNSKCTDNKEFDRERRLLVDKISGHKDLKVIYISSVLVGIKDNDYYNHKLDMETNIRHMANNYIIFRVPQLIGNKGNSKNLVNTIANNIRYNHNVKIFRNTKRALIDVDDMIDIIELCSFENNKTMLISYIEKIFVSHLVTKISNIIGIVPDKYYTESFDNDNWNFKNSKVVDYAINQLKIKKQGYTDHILEKYL